MKNELFFNWITDKRVKSQLSICVQNSTIKRKKGLTQSQISKELGTNLSKIKQIENGTCKDFNAINNYANYFGECLFF